MPVKCSTARLTCGQFVYVPHCGLPAKVVAHLPLLIPGVYRVTVELGDGSGREDLYRLGCQKWPLAAMARLL